MKVDLANAVVTLGSGATLGGRYPFVVVCYDNDLTRELYKSAAAESGETNVWDETFTLNLAAEEKSRAADNRPPPTYLTFFVYDTGSPGAPSLGSAGVLLDTVRENGVAKGDFPVVNGNPGGSLALTVSAQKNTAWYKSDAAKVTAGVVGVGALAAGVAAMAVGSKKKKKKKQEQKEKEERERDELANASDKGNRDLLLHGEDDEDDDDDDEGPHDPDQETDDDDDEGPAGTSRPQA